MKTALIGLGRMGRRHLEVAIAKRLEIVGLCDSSPEALQQAAAANSLSDSRLFADAATMLRNTAPECLIVATHAPSHAELVCQAAESKVRYILCEKPFAVSLTQCDLMLDVCGRYGCRLAVNHQMRYMQQYTLPKQIIDSPSFGGLASATVVAGNFGLAMNGTHYMEMFRFLTGESPAEVSAWLTDQRTPNPRGPQFQDCAGTVRLTTASGKRMLLECDEDQGHGVHVVYAGRNGIIHVDELRGTLHASVRKPEHRELPTTRYGMPADETSRQIAPADAVAPTRAVLDDLLADGDYPTGEQGRSAVATIVAAYVSHENGHQAIRLDDPALPRDRRFPWA